ncbi:hypothetical protein [Pseudomonas rustica]|uniref:hypothetical protein n=1 Tax=Pseudomonas rustica TaxID=2827099 RepID=UPI001BAF13EF|nr:hypothetical protein [Pseudomonas rustica]MBS4085961.1 hypothetical protein [Pseudomonas rustica]
MRAVINFEFLLAPAFAPADDIIESIDELRMLADQVTNLSAPPFLEQEILWAMQEEGYYPSTKLFKEKLSKLEDCPYGPDDVVRMVNRILEKTACISTVEPERLAEWQDKVVMTPFTNFSGPRLEKLVGFFETLSLSCFFEKRDYSVLSFCEESSAAKEVSISGVVNEVYPEVQQSLPAEFLSKLPVYFKYSDFIADGVANDLFDNARSTGDFKCAFYAGAMALIYKSGGDTSLLHWDDFNISPDFLDSLDRNQCMPGDRFGSVLLDSVSHILAGSPKSAVSIFTTTINSEEPRVFGSYIGYRTHLTRSGRGLRLMLWRSKNGSTIFANVGNKFELEISDPE